MEKKLGGLQSLHPQYLISLPFFSSAALISKGFQHLDIVQLHPSSKSAKRPPAGKLIYAKSGSRPYLVLSAPPRSLQRHKVVCLPLSSVKEGHPSSGVEFPSSVHTGLRKTSRLVFPQFHSYPLKDFKKVRLGTELFYQDAVMREVEKAIYPRFLAKNQTEFAWGDIISFRYDGDLLKYGVVISNNIWNTSSSFLSIVMIDKHLPFSKRGQDYPFSFKGDLYTFLPEEIYTIDKDFIRQFIPIAKIGNLSKPEKNTLINMLNQTLNTRIPTFSKEF